MTQSVICVTFNMVLLLLFTHFSPSKLVNAHVCVDAHFSCPDTGWALKSCLKPSLSLSQRANWWASQVEREAKGERRLRARERNQKHVSGVPFASGEDKLSLRQSPWTDYLSISAWWICNFPGFLGNSCIHNHTNKTAGFLCVSYGFAQPKYLQTVWEIF